MSSHDGSMPPHTASPYVATGHQPPTTAAVYPSSGAPADYSQSYGIHPFYPSSYAATPTHGSAGAPPPPPPPQSHDPAAAMYGMYPGHGHPHAHHAHHAHYAPAPLAPPHHHYGHPPAAAAAPQPSHSQYSPMHHGGSHMPSHMASPMAASAGGPAAPAPPSSPAAAAPVAAPAPQSTPGGASAGGAAGGNGAKVVFTHPSLSVHKRRSFLAALLPGKSELRRSVMEMAFGTSPPRISSLNDMQLSHVDIIIQMRVNPHLWSALLQNWMVSSVAADLDPNLQRQVRIELEANFRNPSAADPTATAAAAAAVGSSVPESPYAGPADDASGSTAPATPSMSTGAGAGDRPASPMMGPSSSGFDAPSSSPPVETPVSSGGDLSMLAGIAALGGGLASAGGVAASGGIGSDLVGTFMSWFSRDHSDEETARSSFPPQLRQIVDPRTFDTLATAWRVGAEFRAMLAGTRS